jgi:hypothetical protein
MPVPHAEPCAIEVAAMFGDTVIATKHCVDPRGGALRRPTQALLAGGLAAVLLAGALFALALRGAARDLAARQTWTEVLGRPAHAFRPTPLGPAADVGALAALAVGIAALARGLARARRERRPAGFRVGSGAGVDVALPGPACLDLVAAIGDGFVCHVGDALVAERIVDGVATPLAAETVPLTLGTRLRLRRGPTTFVIAGVSPPRAIAPPRLALLERRAVASFLMVLGAHLGIVALLGLVPEDDGGVAVELAPVVALALEATPPLARPVDQEPPPSTVGAAVRAAPLALSGRPLARLALARATIAWRDIPPRRSRAEAIEEALHAGIFGSPAPFERSLTGGLAELTSGLDEVSLWGGVFGAASETRGEFGGRAGFGITCDDGCAGETVGVGAYATVGGQRLDPTRYAPRLGHHVYGPTCTLTIGQAAVVGDDPAIIRRYLRRHTDQLRYCYERALLVHPDLAGDVVATFFVTPTGAVGASTASGLDPEVSRCVAAVIATIAFPASAAGGGAQVTYPFHFQRTP